MGFLWFFLWAYLAMAVVYLLVSVYSRSVRREKLEDEWAEDGQPGPREDFVEKGLKAYDQSLRRKVIALVFLIPIVLMALITYIQNVM